MLDIEHEIIWLDTEGTKWLYEPTLMGCEFTSFNNPQEDLSQYCCEPNQYIGYKRNGIQVFLCDEHFKEILNGSLNLKQ
jgi:hypothetical protein